MLSYTEKIREIAGRLLASGAVDMVIGFRQGTIPMMNEPHFAKTPAEAQKLVWDSHCGINLANYLTDRKDFMIVSGGVNIYPQEAEDVLVTHPLVTDAAVFGGPDAEMGQQDRAVVQPAEPAALSLALYSATLLSHNTRCSICA